MPLKLKTRCRHRGCPIRTRDGYCDQHQQECYQRAADRHRGSSTERGYDHLWRRLRDWYYRQQPLCEQCLAENRLSPSSLIIEVDHIVPIAVDPTRRLDSTNLQSLCRRHHQLKTLQDRRRYGRASDRATLSNGGDVSNRSDLVDQSERGDEGDRLAGGEVILWRVAAPDHACPSTHSAAKLGTGGGD